MEKKLKHLEFIHNTIDRMSTIFFTIKGWCVTLTSVLYTVSKGEKNSILLISLLLIFLFWILDSYFLSQERKYRDLYNDVCKKEESEIDFSMKTEQYANNHKIYSIFLSQSLLMFYGILSIIFLVITKQICILNCLCN